MICSTRDAVYRFWALKVPPGKKHHGIVTKTQRGVLRILGQLPSLRTLSLTSAMGGWVAVIVSRRLNDRCARNEAAHAGRLPKDGTNRPRGKVLLRPLPPPLLW